jgi:hypothetical protein
VKEGRKEGRMGKVPVRLKEVVYTLSPNQVHVMGGLFKDIPHKIGEKISGSWLNSIFFLGPLFGTYWSAFLLLSPPQNKSPCNPLLQNSCLDCSFICSSLFFLPIYVDRNGLP